MKTFERSTKKLVSNIRNYNIRYLYRTFANLIKDTRHTTESLLPETGWKTRVD